MAAGEAERLRAWRLYFESAMALIDVLGAEMESDAGIPMRWYDVLIHLRGEDVGIALHNRISASYEPTRRGLVAKVHEATVRVSYRQQRNPRSARYQYLEVAKRLRKVAAGLLLKD